jgi:hypothetical protein
MKPSYGRAEARKFLGVEGNPAGRAFVIAGRQVKSMTKLFALGLMFLGALFSLILIPLILVKVVLGLVIALVVLPFKILGALLAGLTRGVVKGMFLLALLMVPLALVALPFTIVAFGAWLLYRALRPRRPPQAYVVS